MLWNVATTSFSGSLAERSGPRTTVGSDNHDMSDAAKTAWTAEGSAILLCRRLAPEGSCQEIVHLPHRMVFFFWITESTYRGDERYDGSGFPVLSKADVWVAMRHGFAASGFMVEIRGQAANPDTMAENYGRLLLGSSHTVEVVKGAQIWRGIDVHEHLCGHHVHAWLENGGGNLTIQQALELSSLSLESRFASKNESYRWIQSATRATPSKVRQHVARPPDRGRLFFLVVEAEETGTLSVPLPWFLRFVPSVSKANGSPVLDVLETLTPPAHRIHGELLFATAERFRVELGFRPRYLKAADWPFDQYHGFLIPPSRLEASTIHYSEPSLLALPEADFSMPFNAVTVQSTILAFFLGSALAALVKRSQPAPQ